MQGGGSGAREGLWETVGRRTERTVPRRIWQLAEREGLGAAQRVTRARTNKCKERQKAKEAQGTAGASSRAWEGQGGR